MLTWLIDYASRKTQKTLPTRSSVQSCRNMIVKSHVGGRLWNNMDAVQQAIWAGDRPSYRTLGSYTYVRLDLVAWRVKEIKEINIQMSASLVAHACMTWVQFCIQFGVFDLAKFCPLSFYKYCTSIFCNLDICLSEYEDEDWEFLPDADAFFKTEHSAWHASTLLEATRDVKWQFRA